MALSSCLRPIHCRVERAIPDLGVLTPEPERDRDRKRQG